MANKRMFSLDIVDTDEFQDMPISSRYLYYELGMRADDDGFMKSPKRLLRTIGCTDDDLMLLVAKGFIIKFLSGVIVITDWRINNTLKGDRYHPSICPEKSQLYMLPSKRYCLKESWNQDGTKLVPQNSIDIDIDIDKCSTVKTSTDGSRKPVDNYACKKFIEKLPEGNFKNMLIDRCGASNGQES